jgi:hydroxyacylglutathione hydrolase
MYESLQKIASLDENTLVYPGHDYTLENYQFATGIEPENLTVKERLRDISQRVNAGQLTIPSTISQERLTNPFLRTNEDKIAAALNMHRSEPVEVFAELRRRKDVF